MSSLAQSSQVRGFTNTVLLSSFCWYPPWHVRPVRPVFNSSEEEALFHTRPEEQQVSQERTGGPQNGAEAAQPARRHITLAFIGKPFFPWVLFRALFCCRKQSLCAHSDNKCLLQITFTFLHWQPHIWKVASARIRGFHHLRWEAETSQMLQQRVQSFM